MFNRPKRVFDYLLKPSNAVDITFVIGKYVEGEENKWNAHNKRKGEVHRIVDDLQLEVIDWTVVDDLKRHHESAIVRIRYTSPAKYFDTIEKFKNLIEREDADNVTIFNNKGNDSKPIKTGSREDLLNIYTNA